jgi:hypothetical protein
MASEPGKPEEKAPKTASPRAKTSQTRTFVSKYEVAEPESYECYVLDPNQQVPATDSAAKSAGPTAAIAPAKPAVGERWEDDTHERPKVKAANALEFEPPDPQDSAVKKVSLTKSVPREKRAVWVVHGMGQQIPFETVDSLARGILSVVPSQQIKPRLRTVKIGSQVLQRVELDIDSPAPDQNKNVRHYELHLYESYWAPKTEGVAKLTDVVGFLWDGGSRGMLNWFKSFKRAMFGGMAEFRIHWLTPVWLMFTMLILLALTVINGVILAAAGAKSGIASLAAFHAHWCQLSALASCMIAVGFSFGAVLFIAGLGKPQEVSRVVHVCVSVIGWVTMAITGVVIVTTALLMVVITRLDWKTTTCPNGGCVDAIGAPGSWLTHFRNGVRNFFDALPSAQMQGFATLAILATLGLVALAMLIRAALRSSETPLAGNLALLIMGSVALLVNVGSAVGGAFIGLGWVQFSVLHGRWCVLQSPVWVWPFLILFSAKVREILVQYVGDVAIYIQPNKLDRFDEVRDKIKEAARSVASAVFTAYSKEAPRQFLYDHVAVVGHSLGSVIVYDTLNRLMLDDWLAKNALQIAERTKAMVTFGSPLNKTAFLFTIQGSDTLHIRERLASTVQPLITSYRKFRELKWINVYSRNDIISGKLKFYDLPGFQDDPVPPEAVQNIIDKDASVPLVAHVSYWNNKTVW